jgi:hypothetical protein
MLIGAYAKSLKMTLVTNNTREFERIQNLKIEELDKIPKKTGRLLEASGRMRFDSV